MSCVLLASGKDFDVEKFSKKSKLKPISVWKKGQKLKTKKRLESFRSSGFTCEVSNKDLDQRKQQIEDAIKFLTKHKKALRRLVCFPGVEKVNLDFGFRNRPLNKDAFIEGVSLPSKLIKIAGSIGLEIEVTFYPCSD